MSWRRLAVADQGTQALAEDYRTQLAASATPLVQGCPTCHSAWFPPRLRCPCGRRELEWRPAGAEGRLIALIRTHGPGNERHRPPARFRDRVPFDSAIVELLDWPGVRLATLMERSGNDEWSSLADRRVRLAVDKIAGIPTPLAAMADPLGG